MIDKKLLKLLGESRKYLFFVVGLMVLAMLCGVGVTYCIVELVAGPDRIYFLIAGVFICLRFVFDFASGKLKDKLGRYAKKELRAKAYEKITRLGASSSSDLGMAGLTQVCLEGIEQLDLYYSSYIPQFFYCMLAPIILFFICLPVCPQSAVVLILLVPLIPISIIAVSRYAKKIFAKYWDKYISMGGEFLDGVSGLEVLKVFRADSLWHKKLNESSEEFRKVTMKVLVMQLASTTIMDTVAYGGAALGIAAAILSMNLWGLSPYKALFIVLVAVDFFLPLRAFGSAFHVAMNGASAGKKLMNLLDMQEPQWGDGDIPNPDKGITLELSGVTFSYDKSTPVIRDASLVFSPGKLTGIVGKSGCGKSTIVGLLEGRLLPQEGHVTANGRAISSLSRENYFSHIAAISYNTYLFHESVRNNFRLANPNITDEEIYKALGSVSMDDVIRQRGGLDSIISEDASNLSGGQRQRLCLAVALASDRDVYILDEATSNIDVESEKIIMDAVYKLASAKTVIVISHRLENVRLASRIYYIEDGRVAGAGTHDELINLCSGYSEMYKTQKALEYNGTAQHEAAPLSKASGVTQDSAEIPASSSPSRTRPWPVIVVKLLSLIGSLTGIIALAVTGGVVGSILALSVTLLGAVAVAKALGAAVPLSYGAIIAMCIVFGLLRGALRFAEQYSNHYIAFKMLAVLRDKLFGALRRLCPAKLETKEKGSIIAMITSDIETLEVFYAHTISPVCIALMNGIFVFLFSWLASDIRISLVSLAGYLTIGVIEPVIFQKINRKAGAEYRENFASFNAYFLDSIKGIGELIRYGADKPRKDEVNRRSDKLLEQTKKIKTDAVLASCIGSLSVSVFILLALFAGLSCISCGRLDTGTMLIGVVAVFGSFGPVLSLANLPANLTQTFASGDRVLDIMEEEPLVKEITDGADFDFEKLTVENLEFIYPQGNTKVLDGVSFSVKKGEIVGIEGPSGCGKSTLLELLLRFFPKNAGLISYNGSDVDRIRTESLLQNVTMVSQDTYLFNVTVRENLLIAKPDAGDEELYEACRMASVHDFIMSLPSGYDTPVGELGGRLSAGEKQRIGLARAFLSGAELILLDEPTSNVDAMSEGIILRSLENAKSHKTFILISHRDSTMSVADRVYRY